MYFRMDLEETGEDYLQAPIITLVQLCSLSMSDNLLFYNSYI